MKKWPEIKYNLIIRMSSHFISEDNGLKESPGFIEKHLSKANSDVSKNAAGCINLPFLNRCTCLYFH